ncbi:MAG TPA: cation:proton antiporter [Candidatus Limnocylindria bacterium]|nr:cation:proton antiporter [Candidatus Limnocylindria bacterium]
MTIGDVQFLPAAGTIALALVSVALFLAALRLFRGPTLADRVIALELIASLMVGIIAVISIVGEQAVLIDVAIALTLVGFLGAVAFARYIEKGTTARGLAAEEADAVTRSESRPELEQDEGAQ